MSEADQKETSKPRSLRPRFSLRTLFLLMTIAGMGVALVRLSIEVVPLREKVRDLRGELGYLVVESRSLDRIQAIALADYSKMTWRWKVYLPAGRSYRLRTQWNEIPEKGMPDAKSFQDHRISVLDATGLSDRGNGELTIVCCVRKSLDGEQWELFLEMQREASTLSFTKMIPSQGQDWIEDSPGSLFDGVSTSQTISESPSSLVLLRSRQMERTSPTSSSTPDGLAKGLMVWIEEDE